MKLLFVNHRDPKHPKAGGAEEVLREIGKRLVKDYDLEVYWLAESVKGLEEYEILDGIKVIRRGGQFTLHLHSPFIAKNYDVVIDSVAHAVPFFSQIFNERTIGLVHHVHQDVVEFELNPLLARIIRFAERGLKFYNRLIAVSDTTKSELVKRFGIDEERITVIKNGVDHEKYKPGSKFDEPTVFWIGRLKKYKNPLDAIEIFRRIRVKSAKLYIAGDGELREEVVKAIGNSPNIKYLGKVSEEDKVRLYQGSWALLSTSFIEGWGMTVVEANASGTPAVVYNRGSLPEIVKDGVNGFVVNYKDFRGAAEKLEYILEDENIMNEFSKRSYESSLQYNWDMTASKYYKVVKEIFI
ncbi:MAG: glycosyltransferase family 4 protein [Sulfolobaceae archaeon]|nr:glycosyltransferase family 4 protein [Sulfolobaceae archaeon]